MSDGPIRVLVVEDSLTVRRYLADVLSADPGLRVVAEAGDGRAAVELCARERPDVVTMDMMLPVMTGLAATEQIMAHTPTPILIVSASTNRGELFRTYEALAAGAVDVLEKPAGDGTDPDWERRFVAAVKVVSRIRVITHLRGRLAAQRRGVPASEAAAAPASRALVAIGASTGGPGALVEVLRPLPRDFRLPVLFVLHISGPFGGSFAEWLQGQIGRPVALASDGASLDELRGKVIMAPPDRHLVVAGTRLRLSAGPERHSCRPSADVLFESVAREVGPDAIGCLLTGMGRDGAAGLLAIRQAGGLTIAQDAETSVVYGMPREAARLGAAELVLPLPRIGARLAVEGGAAERRGRP
jgi:two-component system chemotaxis response regulator CheB